MKGILDFIRDYKGLIVGSFASFFLLLKYSFQIGGLYTKIKKDLEDINKSIGDLKDLKIKVIQNEKLISELKDDFNKIENSLIIIQEDLKKEKEIRHDIRDFLNIFNHLPKEKTTKLLLRLLAKDE